jgi:DNA-binding response OmpR family regulator
LAHDGEHGPNIFEQQPHEIDLVLADISLPKLDGIGKGRQNFT